LSYLLSTDITAGGGDSLLVLTCGDGNGGTTSTAVASVMEDTDAEIDSILGVGFPVPLNPATDKIIKSCAKQIAKYYCYARKPEFYRADGKNPAFEDYHSSIAKLKEIRDGARDLGKETGTPRSALTTTKVFGSNSSYRFITVDDETEGNTGGF
jgi:phage gp36-like protein